MGEEKRLKGKAIPKHETEADWLLSSYIPNQGEIVIYDTDENHTHERQKIGDGINSVKDLPFTNEEIIKKLDDLKEDVEEKIAQISSYFEASNGTPDDDQYFLMLDPTGRIEWRRKVGFDPDNIPVYCSTEIEDGYAGSSPVEGTLLVNTPKKPYQAANKGYVDQVVGDINEVLETIIAKQNSLIGE